MNKRLDYIDATKGVAILIVSLNHILSVCGLNLGNAIGNSFKLVAFWICGGILFAAKEGDKQSLNKYFYKNLFTYMWPYITLSIIHIWIGIGSVDNFVNLGGIGALWFLPTYFIATICLYFLVNSKHPCLYGGVFGNRNNLFLADSISIL